MGKLDGIDTPSRQVTDGVSVITVRSSSGWGFPDFGELWAYRELLYFLVQRDIKVRYRQTILGGLWAVIQPLALSGVLSFVFGQLGGASAGGVPRMLFTYTAMVPFTLFSQALSGASGSLVGGSGLISKVYFPRLIVPLASASSYLVDFAIGLSLLIVMMVIYGVTPSWAVVFLPLFTLLALTCSFAVGLWLSALNVKYRDIRYVVPFILQLLLFASPIGYSVEAVQNELARIAYALNPITGIAEGFRWTLLGLPKPDAVFLVVPTLVTVVLLFSGLIYFRKTERTFADLV